MSACSALGISLLGLATTPARAAIAPFLSDQIVVYGWTTDVGQNSVPALGDLDGDGHLDIVVGEVFGGFSYFHKDPHGTGAAFDAATPNPMAGQDVGDFSTPALGDLDGDGDLDLISGERFGGFVYFENTGSRTSPAFVPRLGPANPLSGQSAVSYSTPTLGDLDGDGDLDLVSGGGDRFYFFENTGTATRPAFIAQTGVSNPLDGVVIGGGTPALGDLDGDGDLDLLAGENFGGFVTLENTGSATSPALVVRSGAANPLSGHDVGATSAPALGDLDGDGDLDLVSGEFDGVLDLFSSAAGQFDRRGAAGNPLAGQDVGIGSSSSLGDLDGDGDLDLVSGEQSGNFFYFENTGGAESPAYAPRTSAANPFDGWNVGSSSSPALGDLDGDGDLDMIAGMQSGEVHYFENTGNAASPSFTERLGAASPLTGLDLGSRSIASLGDLDGDGDLDFVAGSYANGFSYVENSGALHSPAFVLRTGAANPFGAANVGVFAAPALGDVDGDGDLDLIAGAPDGSFETFENIGGPVSPIFVPRTGAANLTGQWTIGSASFPTLGDLDGDRIPDLVSGSATGQFFYFKSFVRQSVFPGAPQPGSANPIGGQDIGAVSGPALADLDRDGDPDLLVGESLGTLRYFENVGTATAPVFELRPGSGNPLDGSDVGDLARPAVGDLDGDGDIDLLVGRSAGDFDLFENLGDAASPLFSGPIPNPFGLVDVGSESAPSLGDLDGDGDLDVLAGRSSGTLVWLENTGDATSPQFVQRTGFGNPFNGIDLGDGSTPILLDFDRNGTLDVVSGRLDGTLAYVKNLGRAGAPSMAPLTGTANPLVGVDEGDRSAPAATDLNGDGVPDLVMGNQVGTFSVRLLPEPGYAVSLGAAAAWMMTFAAHRRRRGGENDGS